MKPETADELATATRHRQLAELAFVWSPPAVAPVYDWAITMAFSSTVHWVAAYFWERHGTRHQRHVEREHAMQRDPALAAIMADYKQLKQASVNARYAALPTISSQDVREAFARAGSIARHLRPLL